MIGKAKAISHGINDLRYIMGESRNKKQPEKINFISCHFLPTGLDAMGVWESMQSTTAGYYKLKNTLIQIELSPSKEYTKTFQLEDWKELWNDFVEEFDKQTILDRKGKVSSRPTNLSGSKGVVFLHEESKGQIPHLHGAFCRVDEDGNVNNDHSIHLRAQRAAEAVARKRGWRTAINIRTDNAKHIYSLCESILRSMTMWTWDDFVSRIEQAEGGRYKVKIRTDSKDNIKGYAIIDNDAKYKASELGRNLTYSRLHTTWFKFHPEAKSQLNYGPSIREEYIPIDPFQYHKPIAPLCQSKSTQEDVKPQMLTHSKPDYTILTPSRSPVDIDVDGTMHHIYLPQSVLELFIEEFNNREVVNWEPLTNLACAYFATLLVPDISASSGGGTNNQGWRRDKDEDDIEFARRCAMMAKQKIGIRTKPRGFHL